MITIIQFKPIQHDMYQPQNNIEGWIMATDIHDARRQAYGIGNTQLANELYRIEFDPYPGKFDLGNSYVMLVS